jgi:hypothetical protein
VEKPCVVDGEDMQAGSMVVERTSKLELGKGPPSFQA